MADLLQELMDDVRADRTSDLWKKHGKWVIYLAVSIILVTAGIVFWDYQKRESAMRQTSMYFAASDALEKGNGAAALTLLDEMSVASKSPFYGLVLLKKAESLQMLGKTDEAKKILAELAKRNDVYGDIGKVLLKNTADASSATPLPFTRSEWTAWELVAKGEPAKAAEQFTALTKKENTPASMRDRAQMMANYLRNQNGGAGHE